MREEIRVWSIGLPFELNVPLTERFTQVGRERKEQDEDEARKRHETKLRMILNFELCKNGLGRKEER